MTATMTQRTPGRPRAPSLGRRLARQAGRATAILLAAGLVTLLTVLLASSPLGTPLTSALAPAMGARPGVAAKPSLPAPTGAQVAAPAAASSGEPAGAAAPPVVGSQGAATTTSPSGGQAGSASARPDGAARTPGGRNTPSLQRGLPDLLRYSLMMGVPALAVVLLLRVRRPTRQPGRSVPAASPPRTSTT